MLALLEGEGAQMVSALGGKGAKRDSDMPSGRTTARTGIARVNSPAATGEQLGLFGLPHPVVERLRGLDINTMTPLQALDQLSKLVDEARAGHRDG